MAQDSILWTTNGTGDGASGGYTQDELTQWQELLFQQGDNQGVLKGFLNGLQVTASGGSASPVTIDTGGAICKGFPYWNDAAGTKNIPTPAGDTRIDRIVIQADWSTQEVRFARIAGSEGGAAPALTQTDNTKWEIPLAQLTVTTGGAITVTDEREFLRSNLEIGTALLQDNFIDGLDGDILPITWNPTNYTPSTAPAQASDVDDLTAHLYGIDQELATVLASAGTHAANHLTGGSDELDGDKLDIDWNPSNYTPSTTPSQANSVDNLTAHLYGIDQKLARGIADNLLLEVDASAGAPNDNEWARFTASGIEGRTDAELISTLTERIQDLVGAMFSGNTETRCTVTYQDGDGTIDVVVDLQDVVSDTSPALGGNLDANDKDIHNIKQADFNIYDAGVSGTAKEINLNNGNYQKLKITGNACDLTYVDAPDAGSWTIRLIGDGTQRTNIDADHDSDAEWADAGEADSYGYANNQVIGILFIDFDPSTTPKYILSSVSVGA